MEGFRLSEQVRQGLWMLGGNIPRGVPLEKSLLTMTYHTDAFLTGCDAYSNSQSNFQNTSRVQNESSSSLDAVSLKCSSRKDSLSGDRQFHCNGLLNIMEGVTRSHVVCAFLSITPICLLEF